MEPKSKAVDRNPPPRLAPSDDLYDVKRVAQKLFCSTRHVRRLIDMGKLPAPVRVGSLLRWSPSTIDQWVQAGCPAARNFRAGGAT